MLITHFNLLEIKSWTHCFSDKCNHNKQAYVEALFLVEHDYFFGLRVGFFWWDRIHVLHLYTLSS